LALLLINGLLICATMVAAVAALGSKKDDPWLGVFALGVSTLLPSLLAWLAATVRSFAGPKDGDVRLAAVLATTQLLLWGGLMALAAVGGTSTPPDWLLTIPLLGTGVYGVAATWLPLRWFCSRRRRGREYHGSTPGERTDERG
jgi:hypothetical protein